MVVIIKCEVYINIKWIRNKYVEEMPKRDARLQNKKKCEAGRNSCDKLRRRKKHTGEKIRHLYDNAHNDFNHMRHSVANRINHKPVQSAAIALAAGFMLSSILRRI